MTQRFLTAGAGVLAAAMAASSAWGQAKVEAKVDTPAADAKVDAKADADAPPAREVREEARETREDARETGREAVREGREAARETGREAREGAREGREAVRETGREAVREGRETAREAGREGRESVREGRETVREGRQAVREARRDTREFRVNSVRTPDIGLWLRSSNEGLLVADIAAEGAIAKIGLREGDRIISVNGQKVTSEREFVQILFAEDVRTQRVEIVVLRDGNQETIVVQPTLLVEEYTTVRRDPLWDFGIIVDESNNDRIVIQRVVPRSPAFYSGLRSGDTIVNFRGRRLQRLADLVTMAADIDAGPVSMEVNRGEQTRQIEIDLPEFGADVDAEARTATRPDADVDVDVDLNGRTRTEGRIETRPGTRTPSDTPDPPARPRTGSTPRTESPDLDTPPARSTTPKAKSPAAPRPETPATPRTETPATPRAEAPATPRAEAPATPSVPSNP